MFRSCVYTLDTLVQFSSSSYIGSESLKGVPVTLLITHGIISDGERITVNVVATSHLPVSAEGTYMYIYVCVCIYIKAQLTDSNCGFKFR